MNLFDFTAESSERKKTLNPFGSYLEKNTDRFVKGAKENIPAPRAKNVKRSEFPMGGGEEEVSKPKPSLKELLAKRYGTEEESADTTDTSVASSSSYSEPTTAEQAVSEPDTSFTSAMKGAGKDLAQSFGAVGAQIPRIGANIASIPLDIVGGRYFGEEVPAAQELAKVIREGGETLTSKAGDVIGLDDTRKKIASVTTDFASTVALPGGVLGSGKVLQGVNLASKTGTKLARAGVSAASGVIDTAKYEAISKGRLPTKNEAIVGGVLSPVLNVAKSVPGIRKLVGKSEILNPGENVLDNGKIIGSVEDVKNEISQAAERLANIKAGGERGEEWVKKEADRVIRGVMKVDEKSIASHKDIAPKMKEQEGAILQMKKLHNQKSTERFGKTSFDDSVTVGGTTNKFNAVDDAFDALSDKAASSQAKLTPKEITSIDELKRRYDTVGLDKDELDTLAGYYGRVNDAFKQGGLVTNKVLSESTRNMMKDKVRTLWGKDDVAESLDKTYSDIRAVREGVDELMGLARNETSRMDNKPLSAVGKFLGDTIQNSTLGVARGFLRALFGTGEIKSGAMSSAEIAKIALEDFKKIRKYKELLDGGVDEKTARGIVDKMRNEFSVGGIIPKPKTLDDTIPKVQKEPTKMLSAPSGKPNSAKEVDLRNIQVPSKGFNSPEITPSSKIVVPTTSAKLKPYKEPSYKTPLPRKKNIPKPKTLDDTIPKVNYSPETNTESYKGFDISKEKTSSIKKQIDIIKPIGLTDKGGIKNVTPGAQVKFNQGNYYKPVRIALSEKDKQIVEYGAERTRNIKAQDKADYKRQIEMEKRLETGGINKEDALARYEEIKSLARESRSKTEEVLLDLLNDTKPKKKNIPKPKK